MGLSLGSSAHLQDDFDPRKGGLMGPRACVCGARQRVSATYTCGRNPIRFNAQGPRDVCSALGPVFAQCQVRVPITLCAAMADDAYLNPVVLDCARQEPAQTLFFASGKRGATQVLELFCTRGSESAKTRQCNRAACCNRGEQTCEKQPTWRLGRFDH